MARTKRELKPPAFLIETRDTADDRLDLERPSLSSWCSISRCDGAARRGEEPERHQAREERGCSGDEACAVRRGRDWRPTEEPSGCERSGGGRRGAGGAERGERRGGGARRGGGLYLCNWRLQPSAARRAKSHSTFAVENILRGGSL